MSNGNILYQGHTPTAAESLAGVQKQIEYFTEARAFLLAVMEVHDNSRHYAAHPESKSIERDNLAFINRRLIELQERVGELHKQKELEHDLCNGSPNSEGRDTALLFR